MAQSKARIRRRVKQYKRRQEVSNVVAKACDIVCHLIDAAMVKRATQCSNPYTGNEFDFCHVEPAKPNATLEILMAKMARL